MEYRIDVNNQLLDLARIEAAVRNHDPAALLDVGDGGQLRVATDLSRPLLAGLLAGAGLAITTAAVLPQPSVCCGGCGG